MNLKIEDIGFGDREAEIETMMVSDETQSLLESIREQGLLNPINVRQENGSYVVVAGLRRLLACKAIGLEEIPVNVVEADAVQAKILNVHENLKRFNLPWYDQVKLVEQLHLLRQEEHGAGKRGRPKNDVGKQGWGIRDTAAELKVGAGPLSEDLTLAREVELDPTLRNIKDKKTAIRMVRLARKRRDLEAEAGVPSALADVPENEVFLGTAADILLRFDDNIFDFCVTDPPWIKFQGDKKYLKDAETFPVFEQLFRVMKFDSLCYIFVGHDDLEVYRRDLPKLGFTVGRVPLIWNKDGGVITYGLRPWEYGRDYEVIMQAAKGEPVLTVSTQLKSILTFKPVPATKLLHPNQKPVELIQRLVRDCSHEGHLMVDPFAGSGTHLMAARAMGRKFIGIERDKDHYEAIVKRLKEE